MGMSRSQQMARIRGKHTTPEKRLRAMLWAIGLRYRLHSKTPGGRPDIVFTRARVAIFIDGCFWHGCPTHYVRPRTRHDFWAEKLDTNVARDRRQTLRLDATGWIVMRLWEHELEGDVREVCRRIAVAVRTGRRETTPSWRVRQVDPLPGGGDRERRYLVDLRDAALRCAEDGLRYSRSGPKRSGLATNSPSKEAPRIR
jgi:DNA mismatch endonuclease (patch repair protein)